MATQIFDCMRAPRGTAQHSTAWIRRITVFVKDFLVNNNINRRIFTDMSECVVLKMDSFFNDRIHYIVLIFT